jgi:hypothetical protein
MENSVNSGQWVVGGDSTIPSHAKIREVMK